MTIKQEILTLFSLLDDPQPEIVRQVLSSLLSYDDEALNGVIPEFQESDNPLLRKHVHQLEAIMTMRQRRKVFAEKLQDENTDLLSGLYDIHLQWFDIDNPLSLEGIVQNFLSDSDNYTIKNLSDLANFFSKSGLQTPALPHITFPEHYCVGVVLDEGCGADVIWSIMAKLIAEKQQIKLHVGRYMGGFVVFDEEFNAIIPDRNWRLVKLNSNDIKVYKNSQLLQYIMQRLFTYAVESDGFRYIHTLSAAITGNSGHDAQEHLPYPFSSKK